MKKLISLLARPVYYYDYVAKGFSIAGVISGYYNIFQYLDNSAHKQPIKDNSGIITCIPISVALDIISKI